MMACVLTPAKGTLPVGSVPGRGKVQGGGDGRSIRKEVSCATVMVSDGGGRPSGRLGSAIGFQAQGCPPIIAVQARRRGNDSRSAVGYAAALAPTGPSSPAPVGDEVALASAENARQ